jgi:hypothetical protein
MSCCGGCGGQNKTQDKKNENQKGEVNQQKTKPELKPKSE